MKLQEEHQLSTIHNHQIAFNFLLNKTTDNIFKNLLYQSRNPVLAWKRLVGYFAPKPLAEIDNLRHQFHRFWMPKGRNQLEAETLLQDILTRLLALDSQQDIDDRDFNYRLLSDMPRSEYSGEQT